MRKAIAVGILGIFICVSVIEANFNPYQLDETCSNLNTLLREKRSPAPAKKKAGNPKTTNKPRKAGEKPEKDVTTAKPSNPSTVKPTSGCKFESNTTEGFEVSNTKEGKPCEEKKCCSSGLEHNRCLPVKDKVECNTQVQGCEYCENSYHKCNTIYFQDTQVCHFEPSPTVCTVSQEDTDCTCNTPCSNLNKPCDPKPPPVVSPPNVPVPISITFDGLGDKIMDIYFLLDFSVSTKADDQRSRMFKYADFLYQKYKEAEKDLRLGFGSFVDKEVVESRSGKKNFREEKNKKGKGGAKKRTKRDFDGLVESEGKQLIGNEAEEAELAESMGRASKPKKPTKKPAKLRSKGDEPFDKADQLDGGVLKGHSFRNVFNLTTSYDDVIKKIQEYTKDNQQFGEVGYNRYTRESQLEALSQIGKCHIGWRDTATKIVVMMTDGGYHEADEDAENQNVGGQMKPYDGNCHLDNTGSYPWDKFKYPKVDQIYKILGESKVTTLVVYFKTNRTELAGYETWKEDYEKDFKQWSDYVKNSKYPAKLFVWTKTDTDGLKKAVDEIQKLGLQSATGTSGGEGGFKISLSPNGDQPKNVEFVYFSKCDGDEEKQTDTCKKMPKNNKLEFTAQVTLTSCDPKPEKPAFELQFQISGISYPAVVRYSKLCDSPPGNGPGKKQSEKDKKKDEKKKPGKKG